MTVRDTIYQQYQKGGEAYATLKGGLMPQYREYIEKSDFKKKSALDIGCGTGQYLAYLKNIGFKVSGKDSSSTAVTMTQAAIGNEGDIRCEDMYTTDIPPNTFDLITSIRTIHHGSKETIEGMIHKIYLALCEEGKIFITLPNYETNNHRSTFADKEEIAPGTFVPLSGPEKGLPHSFFTQEEIQHIFNEFKNRTCELDGKGQRIITGEK